MTIGYWCVLIAAVMPYAFSLVAKVGARYNNYSPREWIEKQAGFRKRAHWAHLNSFEAFPAFAAAVIIAQSAGAAQGTVDCLAIAFIIARLVYGALYMANIASLRSLVWAIGMGCTIALFVVAS